MEFNSKEFFAYLAKDDIISAAEYLKNRVPDYLYKYYSLSDKENDELDKKKLDTLKSNSNWFDLSANQNDPLDMRMAYVSNEQYRDASQDCIELAKELLMELQKSLIICSFIDSDQFNLPMWSAYANNHKGYCVRFRVTKKQDVFKIFYNDNRFSILAIPLSLMDAVCKSSNVGYETLDLVKYLYTMLLILNTKHSSWQNEKEYRLLRPAESKTGQNFSNDELGLIPTDVYIGMNCISKHQKEIKRICQEDLKCKCYKAYTSEKEILNFVEI